MKEFYHGVSRRKILKKETRKYGKNWIIYNVK